MSASSGRRKCTSRYRPRAAAASWPAICAAVRSSLADRGRAEGLYSLAQTGKGEGDTLTAQWPRFFWRSQAETARSAAQDSEAAWHQQAARCPRWQQLSGAAHGTRCIRDLAHSLSSRKSDRRVPGII